MGNHPTLYKHFHPNQFQAGSVVVITGASSGMGKELALRYASRGCKLVLGARSIDTLNALKDECMRKYGNSHVVAVQTDVTKEDEAQRLVEAAGQQFGRIDTLALCAGISAHCLFEDFTDMAPFRQVVETNLYGCVYPVRHALKFMKKSKTGKKGHILVLSSYSGEFGLWHRSCYSASKFAVNGFFESLRMELEEEIDITVVSPITVQTQFRDYSLIKTQTKAADSAEGSSMPVDEAVNLIIEASDRRLPKFIFPFKPWLGFHLKHIAPKTV